MTLSKGSSLRRFTAACATTGAGRGRRRSGSGARGWSGREAPRKGDLGGAAAAWSAAGAEGKGSSSMASISSSPDRLWVGVGGDKPLWVGLDDILGAGLGGPYFGAGFGPARVAPCGP
jgi:hypothetical protein